MKFARKVVGLVHQVENVHAHDAVERVGGDIVRLGEVSDDRRVRIVRAHIEHVNPRRSSSPIPPHMPGILKLQAPAVDPVSMRLEEPVDIVPVNGHPRSYPNVRLTGCSTSGEEQTTSGHAKPSAHDMSHSAGPDHVVDDLVQPADESRPPAEAARNIGERDTGGASDRKAPPWFTKAASSAAARAARHESSL